MSNFLAIAAVTGTLRNVLGDAASVVPGAAVTTKRPDGAGGALQGAGVNIFLYQVTPNAAYRNEDLPTRRADGQLMQRPSVALVLNYMLSFFGEDKELEPQRLLGAVLRQLHARPQLGKAQIEKTLITAPFDKFLGTSNLAEQLDRVRFTPLGLSLDELSKVWSVFFQTPYLLSVAFQASAVLIEPDEAPRSALPVKSRSLDVLPFRQPTIKDVVSEEGEQMPIFLTSTLRIRGKNLNAELPLVLMAGVEQKPMSASATQIAFAIPPGTPAGAHGLQILHKLVLGEAPKTAHRGFESNVATFVLHPKVTRITQTTLPVGGAPALRVNVDVVVGDRQRVVLLLDSNSSAKPASFALLPQPRPAGELSFLTDISKVPAGEYFVRVQIDGAESQLDLEVASATFGPMVTLP